MSVVLVQENGTGANLAANTYAMQSDLIAYDAMRYTPSMIPQGSTNDQLANWLMQAMDYLEPLAYKGYRWIMTQPLQWPRYDVVIDNWPRLYNQIPQELLYAQCALAIAAAGGINLNPTWNINGHGTIQSQEVPGAVRVSYYNNGRVIYRPKIEAATRWISKITRDFGQAGIPVIRA